MLICFPLAVAKQSNEEFNLIKENANLRSQLDSLQNQVELFHNESENCTSVMNSSEIEFSTIPHIEGVDKKCDADGIDNISLLTRQLAEIRDENFNLKADLAKSRYLLVFTLSNNHFIDINIDAYRHNLLLANIEF